MQNTSYIMDENLNTNQKLAVESTDSSEHIVAGVSDFHIQYEKSIMP